MQFVARFLLFLCVSILPASAATFRAGAAIVDISPTNFPVLVNAMFTERVATNLTDPLHARALILDDGSHRIAICVVDTCMISRDLIDRAKALAARETQIRADRILISATHTHSAPAAMGCLGSRADTNYARFLEPRIAQSIIDANARLVPAKVGWAVIDDWNHTFNRRWIRRPDRLLTDPFGNENVRAHMHPGHQSPDAIAPSGPVDPGLSMLAIQSPDGRPLALLANYSQHYYESPLLSSDYYGRFAQHIATLLNAPTNFVAIMSQGTSGDQMWMDYSAPRNVIGYDAYARELAEVALRAHGSIAYHDTAPLRMAERKLEFDYRAPDATRLAWAQKLAATFSTRLPQTLPEVYALEAIYLHERPRTELVMQALRIGDLGLTAIPNEVFALTGLKIKAQSPLRPTFNIELANGAEGYIPPPEQHHLGGYTTWPARTAGLEVGAEPRIVEAALSLLEEVSGRPRRTIPSETNAYTQAVLASKPVALWPLDEMSIPTARDISGNSHPANIEPGVALFLPGYFTNQHAMHFAGGRLRANLPLPKSYTAEFWFWNGLPNEARAVTGYLFSRGVGGDPNANGDHLGLGGSFTPETVGKLIFFNGNTANNLLIGRTTLAPKTWHHLALVRNGAKVTVYLDGKLEPEISGEIPSTVPAQGAELFFGGRNDRFAGLEGKLDDIALFDRALSAEAIHAHFIASGFKVHPSATPRTISPPLSAEESMRKIHVSPGFRVELAAAEPLTLDPVAMDWDVAGRLWVVEMADYPLGMDGKGKPGGRIRILEDNNQDGRYDKSTLFAEGLNFPTGLITWRDGVIVTAAPEILFLRDTNGDGRVDTKQVLFSGFLEGNQQLRINGLRWGLDNWIYCAVGGHYRGYGAATKIKSTLTGEEISLGSRDFRFRPDTGEFEPASGPAQFGRNRDDWGHWFGTQNSNPLWHYVLQDHYLRRNPHVAAPDPTQQLMRPTNPKIFPASPNEKRFHSFEHADRFTSACAGMIYRDDLLFPSTETHAFVCEPFHNLVHHEILTDDGVSFQAHRTPAEQTTEFFASEDRWTRPVMTRTGPDGALWVVDMYRYMIEHPDWLPPEGHDELLPHYREGDDKGRIYRVVPTNAPRRQSIRLDSLSSSELIAALDSPNEWQRDKAHQLLLWRNDHATIPTLQSMALQNKNPLARLHALCVLDGFKALSSEVLVPALTDLNPGLRENALRLAESVSSPAVVRTATQRANDDSPKVRLQLACTLGAWKSAEAAHALAQIAMRDHADPFMRAAVLSSAIPHAEILIDKLHAENGPALSAYSESLYTLALGLDRPPLLQKMLTPILAPADGKFTGSHFARYASFLQLLTRRKSTFKAPASTNALFDAARQALNSSADQFPAAILLTRDPASRAEAMQVLAAHLKPSQSIDSQRAAITALADTADASVPRLLLQNWSTASPEARLAILETLLRREPWSFELLQQLKSSALTIGDFDAARRGRLRRHESERVRQLATQLFDQLTNSNRAKVIADFRPSLQLAADPARGRAVYARACIVCHQRDSQGHDVGPDLRSVVDHAPEKLLTNILDPSLDVQPGFHAYSCVLKNGEELSGLISAETATSVIFKFADGSTRTISRQEIDALRSSNLSLMPDGLENGLSKQDVADLIAFLRAR